MKYTLLIPPVLEGNREIERVFGCTYGLYPIPNIFLLYSAAVLEKEGHDVTVVDAPIEGWSKEDLLGFLQKDNSDVYIFYTVNLAKSTDLKTHSYIRQYNSEAYIIFMGPSPTYAAHEYLVDEKTFVIRGEPEITLLELSRLLHKPEGFCSISGLSYREGEKKKDNPGRPLNNNLDRLPFPARHLIDRTKYFNPKLGITPFTTVLAARGCPFKCRYCVPSSLSFARELEFKKTSDKKPRICLRSAENVIEELTLLKEEGYKAIAFLDDQFVWGEQRTVKICEALKKLGFKWGCLTRADLITEKIVQAMSETDIAFVDIGIESLDQKVLDDVQKGLKLETFYRAMKLLKKYQIPVKLNMLIGLQSMKIKNWSRKILKK